MYTNILQPSDSRTPLCPCAGVIKNNTATVTWQSFNIVSILCISVLSCSSHRFPVHHHIFRRPCEAICFICSETHFLCHSLQVQLSHPVIQTVLEKTSSVLFLLQLVLGGSDLKFRHIPSKSLNKVGKIKWRGDCFPTFEMSLSFCSFTSMSFVRSWTHSLKTFSLQRWRTWRPSQEFFTSGSVRV